MDTEGTSSTEMWWYRHSYGSAKGPISTSALASLFIDGHIDGLTLVARDPNVSASQWVSLSENQLLRDLPRLTDKHIIESETSAVPADLHELLSECDPERARDDYTSVLPNTTNQPPSDSLKETESDHVPKSVLSPNIKSAERRERKRQARKRQRQAAKLRNRENTNVYVTGIPADTTEEELANHFAKCGIIMPNPDTGRPRVKLYHDPNGEIKGDALVTYALRPSVENAMELLDGVPIRPGSAPLQIQEASFEHKKSKTDLNALKNSEVNGATPSIRRKDFLAEALSWAEDGQDKSAAPRIVILKNVFDPATANYDDIKDDMAEGFSQCGEVEKVTVFERNEHGVVSVKFATVDACLKCIQVMNKRWYDGRQLSAQFYDGTSDYRYRESEDDKEGRENRWRQWLDSEEQIQSTKPANDETADQALKN